ncbi:MAG: LysE family transporter [Marinovum sp.]|nr:LysE family transporter [Marinovum sp.]
MSIEAWIIFASFWALFVTTPGPNAVNCISVAMSYGFRRALICVAAILTQASLFLALSAFGITALIAASPMAFSVLKWIGAGFLIYLGIRGWRMAGQPVASQMPDSQQLYLKAFMIATINPKSVAGYLAAFSQFIQPDLPVISQMWAIVPTALSLTTLSYVSYCALGAGLGRTALSAVLNTYVRRILAVCFIIYGLLLGTSHFSKGA